MEAEGGYSKNDELLLLAVVPSKSYFIVKDGLKEIDNKMFFLVCDSYEVSEKGDFFMMIDNIKRRIRSKKYL